MDLDEPDQREDNTDLILVLVADTNVLLANLSLLQEAVQVIGEWQERSPLHFLIPFVVIRELDGLKHSSRSNEDSGSADNTAFVARQATNWLLSVLKTHPTAIQMQGKHEVTDELLTRRDVPNDDFVVDAALYWHAHMAGRVGLLTNDKNLILKCESAGIVALGVPSDATFEWLISQTLPQLAYRFLPKSQLNAMPDDPNDSEDIVMRSNAETFQQSDQVERIINRIAIAVGEILRKPVYHQLVKTLGQTDADHLLRSCADYKTWNVGHTLSLIERHWASLEDLWSESRGEADRRQGSVASRWSSPSKQSSSAAEKKLHGLTRNQLRTFRQEGLPNLRGVLSGLKPSVASTANYAQVPLSLWTRRQVVVFVGDLHTLLTAGRLLNSSATEPYPSTDREEASVWILQWQTALLNAV